MRHTRAPRIGVVGMGHFVYWPQFDGLMEKLMAKQADVAACFSDAVDVVDLDIADDLFNSVRHFFTSLLF